MSTWEPTAYVLDEHGQRVGTITHETVSNGLWRQRWDGVWVRVWPKVEQPSGRHRSQARHKKAKP